MKRALILLSVVLVGCGAVPAALAKAPTALPGQPAVAVAAVGEGQITLDVLELI